MPRDLLRLAAELVFLACLIGAGYWLPIALVERRFIRSPRLGESFPAAISRARRWRWLTVPAALVIGLLFIGLTA